MILENVNPTTVGEMGAAFGEGETVAVDWGKHCKACRKRYSKVRL